MKKSSTTGQIHRFGRSSVNSFHDILYPEVHFACIDWDKDIFANKCMRKRTKSHVEANPTKKSAESLA